MLYSLLDFVFPNAYLPRNHKKWITEFIAHDQKELSPLRETKTDHHSRCGTYIDRLVSAVDYKDNHDVQHGIYLLKYYHITSVAVKLATLISHVAHGEEREKGMVLCPVPLHFSRYAERGFNQSALLTKLVSAELKLPRKNLLWRHRPTGHQAWRRRCDRLTAVCDAFAIRPGVTLPSYVVLIDDIATTGTTLNECAKVLKSAGVKRVDAWVVARS